MEGHIEKYWQSWETFILGPDVTSKDIRLIVFMNIASLPLKSKTQRKDFLGRWQSRNRQIQLKVSSFNGLEHTS